LIFAIAGFILPGHWSTPALTLDVGQSIGRTILAATAFTGCRAAGDSSKRRVSLTIGAILLFFAVWGLVPRDELPAEFFSLAYMGPIDSLLHLSLGAWGTIVGVRALRGDAGPNQPAQIAK
jgi:hypothetical protein